MMIALSLREREFERRRGQLWLRKRIKKVMEKMVPLLELATSLGESFCSAPSVDCLPLFTHGVGREGVLTFRQLDS